MAAGARVAILRADADAEFASELRRVLESLPRERTGPLRVDELSCDGTASLPDAGPSSRWNLAIVLAGTSAPALDAAAVAELKRACPARPILVVLPEELAATASRMLEAGASDFVVPPLRPRDLIPRVLHLVQTVEHERGLVERLRTAAGTRRIIGQSPALLAQVEKLPLVAGCDATLLISGETGTGKELFARAVHYLSRRAGRPFVAVDCGAIPPELIENELFGHERGAYTTAQTAQRGLVEEAAGGSLFLDEVHSLPLAMQVKLLRFLQEKEYRPLGSTRTRRAEVRVIAATNTVLEEAVRAGHFRQDLFFRLNVLTLDLPPLRERRDDIPLLARHFLETYAAEFGRPARDWSAGALDRLLAYAWPGNTRELENVVQRAVLQCGTPQIEARDLPLPAARKSPDTGSFRSRKARVVEEFEREYLTALLEAHDGNVSAAARTAQKDRRALWELLRKHQLLPLQGRSGPGAAP